MRSRLARRAATTPQEENAYFNDLETKLAAYARRFFDATTSEDQDAAMRWVCRALARLLDRCLQSQSDWSRYAWVDDIIDQSHVVDPPDTLSIWGMAIWVDGRRDFFEPFAARLEIVADGSTLRSCVMRFGDADVGLGHGCDRRYRRHLVRDDPPHWLLEFRFPEE